jgi:signal transduction histidine kinase
VARIESGEFTYEMRPFDLVDVAERVARDMRTLASHEIVIAAEPDVPPAYGDAARIWQVMTNLVTNAMKFSPDAGEVRIEISRDVNVVRAAVRDHGIGIAPEDQGRVFDKFTRVKPRDRSQSVTGNGLGLFICRTIIQAHDGELTLESEAGRGSTFAFTLPALQETD